MTAAVPYFTYKGRDASGKLVKGTLEGASSSVIADRLMATGITPLDIAAASAPAEKGPGLLQKFSGTKAGDDDVLMFSRQMHTLLKAGVPIMGALKGLQDSTTNPGFGNAIEDLRESLDAGRELSVALARHPSIFNPFYVSMVKVGEFTGRLEEVFLRLFDHLEFEKFMRDQVRSALRYPGFVVAAMAIAIVIINIFVIPAFAKVFAGFKAELPFMTKLLISFSNFMVAYWPVLLIGAAAAFYGFRAYTNTAAGRMWWDRLKLRIPVAGKIIHKATMARFARSLSLALRSGLPVVQALTTVADTVENEFVGSQVRKMREGVERGDSVLHTATAAGVFTPVVLQMVAVGEESGALDDLLGEIADMYQRDVEYELKTLASQVEPVLIVGLGVLVLILALGVFLPLWDLGGVALKR